MTAESDKEPLDKAIEALLYVKKKQLFLDGNKRTAVILANHILIKSAAALSPFLQKKLANTKDCLSTITRLTKTRKNQIPKG